jgi:hypothetical protein
MALKYCFMLKLLTMKVELGAETGSCRLRWWTFSSHYTNFN